MRTKTLRLVYPFGQTVIVGALLVIVIWGGAEIVLRLPVMQDRLPAPSIGSSHMLFETKLHVFREREVQPDCIFLGSSTVDQGLNTTAFEEAYFAQTGERLDCFNFGIDGGREVIGSVLADLLTQESSPRLIVFGSAPRYLSADEKWSAEDVPWVQYKQGQFSLGGWLADHSAVYGYGILYVNQIAVERFELDQRRALEGILRGTDGQRAFYWTGERYVRDERVAVLPPSPAARENFARLDYRLLPVGAARFDRMLAFKAALPDTAIVVLEMPEHPAIFIDNARVEQAYRELVAQLRERAETQGVLFLPTQDVDFLAEAQYWADYGHLNYFGAEMFSQWAGKQVGQAANEGQLPKLAG